MKFAISSRASRCTLITALSVLIAGSAAIAAEFSAEVTRTMGGQKQVQKIYCKGNSERREIPSPQGAQIVIANKDKKTMWVVFPAKKEYLDVPFQNYHDLQSMFPKLAAKNPDPNVTIKQAGTETIKGQLCDKYVVKGTSKGKDGQSRQVDMKVWVSKKLKIDMKIEQAIPNGKALFEVVNLKEQRLPNSLFEVPGGFKRIAMQDPGKGGMALPMPKK